MFPFDPSKSIRNLFSYVFVENQKATFGGNEFIQSKLLLTCLAVGYINPLSANPTKWSLTLKQSVGSCGWIVSVFEYFVGFVLKGLSIMFLKSNEILQVYIFEK